MMDPFFYLVIAAGALAGGSIALLGVYVVGMRMPFIGTCISHSAMAGVVLATLIGMANTTLGAIAVSVAVAMSLSAIPAHRGRLDNNVGLAILFSLMLGVTFLGMGLMQGSRSQIMGLLWGSILFIEAGSATVIAVTAVLTAAVLAVFNKELKVLLFSRSIAVATGMHERFVYCIFLALCGVVISVNLKIVGGLLIFALLTNPAAAAYQVCSGFRSVVAVSAVLGMLSVVGGFLISLYLNLPTGACIVLVSTVFFAFCFGYRRLTGSGIRVFGRAS